jgi:hypothetical protein
MRLHRKMPGALHPGCEKMLLHTVSLHHQTPTEPRGTCMMTKQTWVEECRCTPWLDPLAYIVSMTPSLRASPLSPPTNRCHWHEAASKTNCCQKTWSWWENKRRGVGLKTKRKRTETCFIVFVSLYLIGIENGIGIPGNEYENGNHRIWKWNGYVADTLRKQIFATTQCGMIPWFVDQKTHIKKKTIKQDITLNFDKRQFT